MLSAGRSLLIAPLLAVSLQGCIAAVIPLAAAGAMGTTIRDNPETPAVETRVTESVDNKAAVSEQTVDVSADAAMASNEAGEFPGMTPAAAGAAPERADLLEPPVMSSLPSVSDPAATATFAQFADYAIEVAARDPLADEIRPSAILASSDILTPDRAPCRFNGSAVLIDLDPEDGLLETDAPMAQADLAAQLARLRAEDVEIVWSTGHTADRAGDVRRWLATAGLDPEGEDRLLLLRYADDRKQTRREEAAKERCLVAMLGDERSDFDELFDYLKRPGAAAGLDKMLGQGWFLAPIPSEGQTE